MLQQGKQKIKQAVLHPDLMQVLYDELFTEQQQTMATSTLWDLIPSIHPIVPS